MSNCGREQSFTMTDGDKRGASVPMTSGLLPGSQSTGVLPPAYPGWVKVMIIRTFTKSLLGPTDHSKPCAGTIWPNSHNSKSNSVFLSPSYKGGKRGLKALRYLPRVIQPVNSGAGLYPGAWLPSRAPFCCSCPCLEMTIQGLQRSSHSVSLAPCSPKRVQTCGGWDGIQPTGTQKGRPGWHYCAWVIHCFSCVLLSVTL